MTSESSLISIASAVSFIQFRSWFSFFTLCCAESILRANWTLIFNLSSIPSSIDMSGISLSTKRVHQYHLHSGLDKDKGGTNVYQDSLKDF